MTRFISFMIIVSLFQTAHQNKKSDDFYDKVAHRLIGSWQSKAWSGDLHETWVIGKDNWLIQQAFYFEKSDTSYRAHSKIEQVKNDLILFTVIKDSNPKIFKATIVQSDSIVFENRDYKNPFKVVYFFDDVNHYRRTITGFEQDSLVSYTFNFKRVMKQ